jgi:hypothetical protein
MCVCPAVVLAPIADPPYLQWPDHDLVASAAFGADEDDARLWTKRFSMAIKNANRPFRRHAEELWIDGHVLHVQGRANGMQSASRRDPAADILDRQIVPVGDANAFLGVHGRDSIQVASGLTAKRRNGNPNPAA